MPFFYQAGSVKSSFFTFHLSIGISWTQNCMMAACRGWAFWQKYSKCSTTRGGHHTVLKCRKGTCTKTTKKKTFDSQARSSPYTPRLSEANPRLWFCIVVTGTSWWTCKSHLRLNNSNFHLGFKSHIPLDMIFLHIHKEQVHKVASHLWLFWRSDDPSICYEHTHNPWLSYSLVKCCHVGQMLVD